MRFWIVVFLLISFTELNFAGFFNRQLYEPCIPLIDDCKPGLHCRTSASCLLLGKKPGILCCRSTRGKRNIP
ncbi:hypothetical protein I4U23_010204 [Adineta vaga]|nr:hypothetical protein I4U23_010204 [Adineta vaga]